MMSEAKRSGRQARQAERSKKGTGLGRPFIMRNIPTYDVLSEENLIKIERAADRVLAETGIEFRDDPDALQMWRKAGAKVEGLLVKFEPGMLREILKTAPATFTQHARNPAKSVEIGGKSVVYSPAKRHLDMVLAHMTLSDRPYMGSVTAENRSEDNIEMSRILFGADFVDQNCVILGNVNVNSPLVWDGTMTKSLRAYARANQAAVVVPFILGGAMGPVTSAGGIVQSLAETMVGCALTQLERKGAPVIFGNFLSSMSLRSGSPTFGTPEPAIGSMVIGQLARRLNLPLRCSGNFTTSKLPDAQAMMEGTMSMLAAVHCGANFILHSAGFLDGLLSMSYEKFMLDADLCGALHAYLDGVKIDDDQLAVDAFAEVGPGNHFFGCSHTMAHYETAFWDSDLSDNEPFEKWEAAGSTDAATRANALWKKRLAEYEAPPMDVATLDALNDYVARKKAGAADAWY